jgi:exopolysaccharide production protein ExoY
VSKETVASAFAAQRQRAPSRTTAAIRLVYCAERFAAALALIVLSPVMVAVAVTIGILSGRGPLVLHTRVGRNGAPLHMLKFRTMWDVRDRRAGWFTIENVSGVVPTLKKAPDLRITSRFAALCRRHSLDELPQLWHVVRGEMSLVGPRPITRKELDLYYSDCEDEVLSVKPGLTGLWQVMGRNGLTYARRRRLDLIFVRRMSAGLYMRILLRSLPRVIRGTGAY